MKKIRIACGAGFAMDRIDPAIKLAEEGEIDYLILECLAERTIGLARLSLQENKNEGYKII